MRFGPPLDDVMNQALKTAIGLDLKAALAAAAMLALGMGFGRFAYTGLYPLMVRDGLLDIHGGSLAAAANYAGYLLGALLVIRTPNRLAPRLCRLALVGSVLCLAGMALDGGLWLTVSLRTLAGVFSAIGLVAASGWLLHYLGQGRGAALLYAGVGIGIVISAELIALTDGLRLNSQAAWLVLAGAGTVLSLLVWPLLRRPSAPIVASVADETGADELGALRLVLAYGLAGFGYIVTATYLPLLIHAALGEVDPLQAWALFGLGAAPSCFLWHALHMRFGTRHALILNLLVQAIGVALPALSHTPVAYLASALLVGGTFAGTVTIALPAARRIAPQVRFNMVATMTVAYSLGQIAGPLLANQLYARSQGFDTALLAAAATLVLAIGLCLPRRR
jgi:MFS family permease